MDLQESVVDDEGVVRIGSVVFALIRPAERCDLAFNEWYERDHYYTFGLAAPGVFSAGRYIEPKQRLHLALYFVLPGYEKLRASFVSDQHAVAADQDRLFGDREHLHTWSYLVESSAVEGSGVPPALVLDRRYRAVTVAWCDENATTLQAPVVLTMRTGSLIMPSSWDLGIDPTKRRMVLAFHDDKLVVPPGLGVYWSGCFKSAVFGTDTYVTP